MATGGRLLNQIMPDTYRQGYTYRTKLRKGNYNCFSHKKSLRNKKRMGSKLLRKFLKDKLQQQIESL